jgi:hypothetical protein
MKGANVLPLLTIINTPKRHKIKKMGSNHNFLFSFKKNINSLIISIMFKIDYHNLFHFHNLKN